jgi:predicted TIM-barrel fold metal-dependent hydrolase
MIDAHHHLWDLNKVSYPWLEAKGVVRFFGDPTPIQRNYLLTEFRENAGAEGFRASVHIQVGATDPVGEAEWIDSIAQANPDWPLVQVVYCDLTSKSLGKELDLIQKISSVRGVRQIVGRSSDEDTKSGTNDLLISSAFRDGLVELGKRNLSFDLQLTPALIVQASKVMSSAPDTKIVLCHAGSPSDRSEQGLERWSKDLRLLSSMSNIFCKLSGLGMFDHNWTPGSIAPIVNECVQQFGPSRCMFGSNFPVDSLYSDYSFLMQAYRSIVPKLDFDMIFGKTAEKFYNIN